MSPRLYFDSMAGRLFVFLLVGVVSSAGLALGIADLHRQADLGRLRWERLADRVQDFVSLADNAPSSLRTELMTNGVPGIYPSQGQEQVLKPEAELTQRLTRRFGPNISAAAVEPGTCFPHPATRSSYSQMHCWLVSARMTDGRPLRFTIINPRAEELRLLDVDPLFLITLVFTVGALTFFAARMAAAPLRHLSRAARSLGSDLDSNPLPERGPNEVRDAIRAFNTMQAQLRRHLAERTQILASITHDLQTPLTRLRLRLEKVNDIALRSRLVDDLQGMQILIREGLDFSRGNQIDEPFAPVALDALLESLVEDAEERGQHVQLLQSSGYDVEARPRALQRCLANLLDNALKYGGETEIAAQLEDGVLKVRIRDHGPGIPADKLESAFAPFVRLDNAQRHRANGAGLGLTIARMLAQKNDADLALANHREGGLEAVLVLRRGLCPTDSTLWNPKASLERSAP
jgi:signal transduction histidine kinase